MDLRRFDLNLLLVFDRLMETRSVTATARGLGLTQSTVSAALRRLRSATRDRLLERQGNAMIPTTAAMVLWPQVGAAIAAIEAGFARLEAFDPARHAATFRIGMDEYACIVLGGRLFAPLRREAPGIRIEIVPVPPPIAEEALASGAIALAVGASWTSLPGLRVERLFGESFAGLVDRGSPPPSALDDYLKMPHLLVSAIGRVSGNVDSALVRIGRQRQVGLTVPYLLAAPQALLGTGMILNVGRRLAEQLAGWYPLTVFEPPVRIPGFAIAMTWHPRNDDGAAHLWLRERIAAAARVVP